MPSFCQDRLGTNISPRENTQNREVGFLTVAERIARLQQEPELRAQLLSEHTWDPTAKWRPTAGTPVPQEGETVEEAFFALMDFALVRKEENAFTSLFLSAAFPSVFVCPEPVLVK